MSDEVKVEYVYEYWDCPQCGRRGLRGDLLTCPDCGTPRNENVRFYRKDGQEETVSDRKQIERFESGPDWKCSFCTNLNPALQNSCQGCGHTREESDKNYFEVLDTAPSPKGDVPDGPRTSLWRWLGLALALTLVAAIAAWFWASRTHGVDYRIASLSWERAIPILRYQWVEREDWASDVQGESVERISERRDIHHYEKKLVGTRSEQYSDTERVRVGDRKECSTTVESAGNGAAKKVTSCRNVPQYANRTVRRTRDVPIYRDIPVMALKVRYKAKTYAPFKVEKLTGSDNRPRWPDVKFGKGLDEKPDREGTRSESYLVTFDKMHKNADGPAALRARPDASLFERKFEKGDTITIDISNAGALESPFPGLLLEEIR